MSRALLVALLALSPSLVSAQAPDAARIRAAFLKMIDRPRVPLAAEAKPRGDGGVYRAEHFSFASEAGERVPGGRSVKSPVSSSAGVNGACGALGA